MNCQLHMKCRSEKEIQPWDRKLVAHNPLSHCLSSRLQNMVCKLSKWLQIHLPKPVIKNMEAVIGALLIPSSRGSSGSGYRCMKGAENWMTMQQFIAWTQRFLHGCERLLPSSASHAFIKTQQQFLRKIHHWRSLYLTYTTDVLYNSTYIAELPLAKRPFKYNWRRCNIITQWC